MRAGITCGAATTALALWSVGVDILRNRHVPFGNWLLPPIFLLMTIAVPAA
jgi:hypothetical protein